MKKSLKKRLQMSWIPAVASMFMTGVNAQDNVVELAAVTSTVESHLSSMVAGQKDVSRFPRSIKEDGSLHTVKSSDWTSGFFPGTLWYTYELTKDNKWKELAANWSKALEKEKSNKTTHDLGFMLYCPFGNGYRLTNDPAYKEILLQGAASLSSRYHAKTKTIRSWDKPGYQFPVIIDNMMNLELLFWATQASGDSSYYKIAVAHADQTMRNHFRKDNSSYHVVDYDTITGQPIRKITHQGYSDESAWVRGQAWGLYGYTVAYRFTHAKRYLLMAEKIASFYLNHPKLPKDKVPYWDFNAPVTSATPRDASAAAIVSAALLELADYSTANQKRYRDAAGIMLKSLSSPAYLAELGTNQHFILKHSTGHLPHKSEIDVPINYADYYFVEALLRYKNANKNEREWPQMNANTNEREWPRMNANKAAADVIVYTANPGGIMAAIGAAREGASVLLIEPSAHIGGIVAQGGLVVTDIGNHTTIGGLSKEFMKRAADYYREKYGENSAQFKASIIDGLAGASFEPKVAEEILEKMIAEYPSIKIVRNTELVNVNKNGKEIKSIVCRDVSGNVQVSVEGKVFIDASYTGDLVAKAGIDFLLGTDGKNVFNEPSVPQKSSAAIQAFNYRVTMTNDSANRVMVDKPVGYDPADYSIRLAGLLKDSTSRVFKSYWKVPNKKIDANIADMPGVNWNYPSADYSDRKKTEQMHRKNSLGYIYFLQNDPQVPLRIRTEAREWGLAKDEFTDNGNFPRHIYIREGRRLNGAYVMRQQDLQVDRKKDDAIALGSYSMDSHATMVTKKPDGTMAYTGGGLWEPVKAYEIPYRALLPKASQSTNLLVPVCLSSSHLAWTSLRMEPVFMMTGEAAGVAAAMASSNKIAAQNIQASTLRQKLQKAGAIVNLLPETVADFDWSPKQPRVGETVTFTFKQTAGNQKAVKYYWDFDGDGVVDAGNVVEKKVMKMDKAHLVSLVVEDSSGKKSQPIAKTIPVGSGLAGDIQIDSEDDKNVTVKLVKKSIAQTPFWGTYFHTDGNLMKGSSYASYDAPIKKTGKYAVYVSSIPGNGRSANTLVEVKHAKGTEKIYIDQRKAGPLFGLIRLGVFEFEAGGVANVTIFNNDPDKYILYDVARWVLE
jgi:unsaturated chondroitin disaccharide hydrolase